MQNTGLVETAYKSGQVSVVRSLKAWYEQELPTMQIDTPVE